MNAKDLLKEWVIWFEDYLENGDPYEMSTKVRNLSVRTQRFLCEPLVDITLISIPTELRVSELMKYGIVSSYWYTCDVTGTETFRESLPMLIKERTPKSDTREFCTLLDKLGCTYSVTLTVEL